MIQMEEINMIEEISVFEAKCDKCRWHVILVSEHVITYLSEAHMMETGHTINITEVI
jgi:hypothetical protein